MVSYAFFPFLIRPQCASRPNFQDSDLFHESVRAAPLALDHVVLVDPGEKVLLEVVEGLSRDALVKAKNATKGLLGHTAVFELCEQDFLLTGG